MIKIQDDNIDISLDEKKISNKNYTTDRNIKSANPANNINKNNPIYNNNPGITFNNFYPNSNTNANGPNINTSSHINNNQSNLINSVKTKF